MSGHLDPAAAASGADWYGNGSIRMHDVTQHRVVAHIVAELDDEDGASSDDRRAGDRTITSALVPIGLLQ